MKKQLLITCGLALALFSCSKEKNSDSGPTPGDKYYTFQMSSLNANFGLVCIEESNRYPEEYCVDYFGEEFLAGTTIQFSTRLEHLDRKYSFDQWSDGNKEEIRSVVLNSDFEIQASFVKTNVISESKAFDAGSGAAGGTGLIEHDGGYFMTGFTTTNGQNGDFLGEDTGVYGRQFLIKVDIADRVEWIKTYEGEEFFAFQPCIKTDEGLFFFGGSNQVQGLHVRFINFEGEMLWSKVYEDLQVARSTIKSSSNTVIFNDETQIYSINSSGDLATVTTITDLNNKGLGDDVLTDIRRVDMFPNGNLLVAGRSILEEKQVLTVIEIDQTQEIINKTHIDYGGNSNFFGFNVKSVDNETFIIHGTTNSTDGIFENGLSFEYNYEVMLKIKFNQAPLWVKFLKTDQSIREESTIIVKNDNIYTITGSRTGGRASISSIDFLSGDVNWNKTFHSGSYTDFKDFEVLPEAILFAGVASAVDNEFNIFMDTGRQYAFLLKTDLNGNVLR